MKENGPQVNTANKKWKISIMHIDNLIIEVTRKCNMSCEHCLRGQAENRNIDINLFRKFIELNRIDSISCLSITGGEPLLNPSAIIRIAHVIHEQRIDLFGFFLATNGTVFSNKVIESLAMFRHMVDEDEMFTLTVSKDYFHDEDLPQHPIWKLINHTVRTVKRENVIAEGRGRDVNPKGRLVHNEPWTWEDGDIQEGNVYINALGMVCKECDFSYESQRLKNIGHCLEKRLIEMEDNDYDDSEDIQTLAVGMQEDCSIED